MEDKYIKIIIDSRGPTGSDETSCCHCHFQENPTLNEFVEWVLKNRKGEWGEINMVDGFTAVEYRFGEMTYVNPIFDEIKDMVVSLKTMSGGWSRNDYILKFEE